MKCRVLSISCATGFGWGRETPRGKLYPANPYLICGQGYVNLNQFYKSDVKCRITLGHLDQYGTTWLYCETVIQWNSRGDRFVWFKLNAWSVEAHSTIPKWLKVLRVQWWRDCETVSEKPLKQAMNCFTVKMHTTTMQTNKFWNQKWKLSSRSFKLQINRDLNSGEMHLSGQTQNGVNFDFTLNLTLKIKVDRSTKQ